MRIPPTPGRLFALAASGLLAACTSAPSGPVTEAGDLASGDLTLTGGEFQDGYTVRATAGQWIKVDLRSTAFDPYLILRTPSDQQSENDDIGGDRNHSGIVYQATEDGQFQIVATSYAAGETGAYTLVYEVTDAEPAAAGGATADAPPADPAPGGGSGLAVPPGHPPVDGPPDAAPADADGAGGGIKI